MTLPRTYRSLALALLVIGVMLLVFGVVSFGSGNLNQISLSVGAGLVIFALVVFALSFRR